jgi:hypothetical protein
VFGSCAVSPHSVLSEVPTTCAARSRCCRSATAGNPRIFSWITILDGAAMLALFSRPTAAGSGQIAATGQLQHPTLRWYRYRPRRGITFMSNEGQSR